MGLLGCGRGRGLVGEGVETLRLGVSVVRTSSSCTNSSSNSGEASLSGTLVSGTTSMVVVSFTGVGVVGTFSSSFSSLF